LTRSRIMPRSNSGKDAAHVEHGPARSRAGVEGLLMQISDIGRSPARQQDAAFVRGLEAGEHSEQRGLAAAARARAPVGRVDSGTSGAARPGSRDPTRHRLGLAGFDPSQRESSL
jgi:hypothetical protein